MFCDPFECSEEIIYLQACDSPKYNHIKKSLCSEKNDPITQKHKL